MEPEPITATAPRAAGRTVFTQDWMDLTFIHWAVAPEVVAPFMPPGVRPDVFDGLSYVALVPFSMQRIGLFGAPAVPYFGSFLETNVRLYGVDGEGRRGVVFCSLEASRLATVALTRWTTGLNYLWARMRLQREGDRLNIGGQDWRVVVGEGHSPEHAYLWGRRSTPRHSSSSSPLAGVCSCPIGAAAPATGPTSTQPGHCEQPRSSTSTTNWSRWPAFRAWSSNHRSACCTRRG